MIKFRAWDKENDEMLFPDDTDKVSFVIEAEGVETYDMRYPGDEYSGLAYLDTILMQSTGLKDLNGVEIFEGDIVRYTWDMLSDVNATEKGKKVRISKVFWSDWRASWAVGKKSCNNDLFRYARNGNTVEVIGNIYEQPELLSSGLE